MQRNFLGCKKALIYVWCFKLYKSKSYKTKLNAIFEATKDLIKSIIAYIIKYDKFK
jgi:hypothetical protein